MVEMTPELQEALAAHNEQFVNPPPEKTFIERQMEDEARRKNEMEADRTFGTDFKTTAKFLAGGAETLLDMGVQGAQMTGVLDDVGGLAQAFNALIPGGETPFEAYERGVDDNELLIAKSRDRLRSKNQAYPFIGDVAGAMHPKSIQSHVARWASNPAKTGKFLNRLEEVVRQGGGGFIDAAVLSALEGGIMGADGAVDAAANLIGPGIYGAVGAFGGQAVFGEMLPGLFKYGMMRSGPEEKVGRELLDQGPTTSGKGGFNPADIREVLPEIASGKTLGELGIGGLARAETMDRFAIAIGKAEGVTDVPFTGGANQHLRDAYLDTSGLIYAIGEEADTAFRNVLDDTLGVSGSTYSRKVKNNAETADLRKQYANMEDTTVAGKNGARPVNYTNFMDSMSTRVAANMKKGEVEDIGKFAANYLHDVSLISRGLKVHTKTRVPYVPKSGKAGVDGEMDLNNAEIKLAGLVAARKYMSSQIRPGTLINGTSQSKQNATAALSVLEAIDAELAARTFGKHTARNAEFSRMLKMDETHQLGKDWYTRRLREDPEMGMDMNEYMESLRKTYGEDAVDGFKTGYGEAMLDGIKYNGVKNEVGNFTGGADLDSLDRVISEKSGNIEDLQAVMGKSEALAFLKEVNERTEYAHAVERMAEVIKAKGRSPAAIQGLMRDGDDLLVAAGFGPGQNAVYANATIAALARRFKSLGPQESALIEKLMKAEGPEGAKQIEDWLTKYEMTSEQMGGPMGFAFTADTGGESNNQSDRPEINTLEDLFGAYMK